MADRDLEYRKEQIKYETEVLRLIVLLGVAIGGGSFGVLFGAQTPLRLLLAGVGFLVTVGLALVGWRQHRWIRARIAELKER